MKSHRITGGGGVQLHLVETGNSSGRPIFFIHGFSQCWLAWNRQLSSDLAKDYRLVAMDMNVILGDHQAGDFKNCLTAACNCAGFYPLLLDG